ncbi:MAG TPA: hypothetical protein VNS57_03920, partial [Steroidobacteraceae bacterium]|nr:hypothetical protein [Steroidobacteraceae bacterium]
MALDKAALDSLRIDRESDAGRYHERGGSRRWLWIAVVAVVVLGALFAWRGSNSAVEVQTVTIEAPAANGAVLNASGYVVARRLATVSSKVTGRVAEVLFEEGTEVSDGQ